VAGDDPAFLNRLRPLTFADLSGWTDDDHAAAFAAFRKGASVLRDHPPKQRGLGADPAALAAALADSMNMPAAVTNGDARAFFEQGFAPFDVAPAGSNGFFTGYYEPIVPGARTPSARFRFPLYRQPPDLVEVTPGEIPGLDRAFRFARRTGAGYAEFPDRQAIMEGALVGRGLEIAWLADAVDAFFIHVQGAARIALEGGGAMGVTYAAKSGHPYTPIGRVLVEMGALTRDEATMQGIRSWLAANPDQAAKVMARNRSYIFFRETPVADDASGPIAAAKVALAAGRSLAVDRTLHAFHSPVWVETTLPDGAPFRRLTIAHDTGSAIVGPARGDIFFGSGDAAGEIAGAMRAPGRFVLLVAREQ
jgi:membrane-bound lytic murein transglycosylase A